MRIPWLSLAVGLLIYLITGSLVTAVAVFVALHFMLLLFVGVTTAVVKGTADKLETLR